VVDEVGEPAGHEFLKYIKELAAMFLWAIPQYDYDKLSVLYKASKHHSKDTQEEISNLSLLERMNWLVPQMSDEYNSDFVDVQGYYSHYSEQQLNKEELRTARRYLRSGLHPSKLKVYSSKDKTAYIPRNPLHFSCSQELTQAADFLDELNKYIAEQEAESEDN